MSSEAPVVVAPIPLELVCQSDFLVIGFQRGERPTSCIRVVCTLITVSIISSWCNKRNISRLLLFFSHWLSGLVHQLAELVLAEMVLLCWGRSELLILIKALKFIELVGGNMLAVTNLAICVNLALVVSSHRTMSRVRSVTSPRLIMIFLAFSVAATVAAVPFWDTIMMSGTLMWTFSDTKAGQDWVVVSIFFLEMIAGVAMSIVVALLLLFRRPELRQVWKHHRRIKYYFGLTAVAIVTDLAIGVGGILYLTATKPGERALIISTTWTMRHLHIALDTLVLYSALGASRFELESSQENGLSSEEGSRLPKRPSLTSGNGKRRKGSSSSIHNLHSPSV